MLDDLIVKLEKEKGFYRKKHNPHTIGRWESYKDDDYSLLTFSKNIARKGYGNVGITIYEITEDGLEIKIELKISSDPDWETFFQGYLECKDDINHVFRLIGI